MIIHVEKDKQELPLVKLTDISQLTTSVNAIFRQIFRKTVANRPKKQYLCTAVRTETRQAPSAASRDALSSLPCQAQRNANTTRRDAPHSLSRHR